MSDQKTNLSDGPRQEDAELREALQRVLHSALQLRRQAIVYTAAREMHGIFQQLGIKFPSAEGLAAHGWTRIESLSRLRAIVGGRFKNLKEKWVGAGFPLREHRGDRDERAAGPNGRACRQPDGGTAPVRGVPPLVAGERSELADAHPSTLDKPSLRSVTGGWSDPSRWPGWGGDRHGAVAPDLCRGGSAVAR